MSIIYCLRCDRQHDTDFEDCVVDPGNSDEIICWDSLSEQEREDIENDKTIL